MYILFLKVFVSHLLYYIDRFTGNLFKIWIMWKTVCNHFFVFFCIQLFGVVSTKKKKLYFWYQNIITAVYVIRNIFRIC